MHPFHKEKKAVSKDKTFVALVHEAQEDADFRKQLCRILSLDEFNRKSALNTLIANMSLQKAPGKLIDAMGNLLDDAVAKKTLEMIKNV